MQSAIHADILPLPWESDFFATASARLAFSEAAPALTRTALAAYAVVQAKIPASDVARADALAAWGFHLAESEVDLCLSVNTVPGALPAWRVASVLDIPLLANVARQAFTLSRFRPPWYRPQDSQRFYAQWVENAIRGTFDNECVLALDAQGDPFGWVTLRQIDATQARIGLLALWPGKQGQGMGVQLMTLATAWCQQRQLSRLWVATQLGNHAALRLYQRCGAQIQSTAHWFYK